MSGNNVFGNSPVSGGRFASPVVKIGVTVAVGVGLFAAYMVLSGQASSYLHGTAGPPDQPSATTTPSTTPFTPMPVVDGSTDLRPKAAGPTTGSIMPNLATNAVGAPRSLDLYSANVVPIAGGGGAAATSEETRPDKAAQSALAAEVTPTKFAATGVTELPDIDYLIEQGRYLPCTQMSFINSTYAGAVTAIIPVAIRGSTGNIELIGPGATLFGTIEHGISNGVDRVFVLWQQITTPVVRDQLGIPHKFRVAIDSPASDQIGQTGLDGDLDRHLPSKFAAVIGLSVVEAGTQALPNLLQRSGNNNTNTSLNFNQVGQGVQSGSQMLMQQFLNVPDVLTRLQGKGCAVSIVRDIDLKKAYPKLRDLLAIQGGYR